MEKPKYTRINPNSNNISLPNQPYKGSWKENSKTRKVPAPKKDKVLCISQQSQKERTTSTESHLQKQTYQEPTVIYL
jgi:hypothetical protein